mgnify:CR=1 FL=1
MRASATNRSDSLVIVDRGGAITNQVWTRVIRNAHAPKSHCQCAAAGMPLLDASGTAKRPKTAKGHKNWRQGLQSASWTTAPDGKPQQLGDLGVLAVDHALFG